MSPPKLNPIEPPWYGPVCPVVWEGRRREASPYPDQVLGLLGHRLHLRLDEFRLQLGEVLDVPHLHQPLCKLESARDIALGITEDFVAKFRTAHDIAGNRALKELE